MALTTQNTDQISFKKLSGKAHTQQNFSVTEEGLSSSVQLSNGTIFGAKIEKLPVTSSGLTTPYATNGIVERIKFPVDLIPDTEISAGRSQGYRLKLPADYSTNGALKLLYSSGTYLNTSLGKLQMVPSLYGQVKPDGTTEYDPILYQTNGSTVITKFDSINWYLDTYNGVLFVQDPPAGFDVSAARPGFVEGFLYVGHYADKTLEFAVTGITVNNGLTKVGTNIRLGGALTGDTIVKGGSAGIVFEGNGGGTIFGPHTASLLSGDFNFIGHRSWVNAGGSGNTAGMYQANDSSKNHYVEVRNDGVDIYSSTGSTSVKLLMHPQTGAIFTDGRTIKKGFQYAGNYSAGFGKFSLVDKNYVTGTTFLTANNGITKSGSNFSLGGTLTGNTLLDTSNKTFIVDYGTAFETGNTAIIRATVGGTEDVTHLGFRHDSSRALNHGFTDIRLGTNAGNPSSPAGGNISIGQNVLTNLVRQGTFTSSPFFSTFRGDRNIGIGYDIATGWTTTLANAGTSNIMMGVRAGKTQQPFSYNVIMGFEASSNIGGAATTWESNVAIGSYALSTADFLLGADGAYGSVVALGNSAGFNATFRDGFGTVLLGAYAGYNAALLEDYEILIGGAGDSASLGRGNIGIGERALYGAVGGSAGAIGVGTNQFNVAIGVHAMEGSGPSEKGAYVGCEAGQGTVKGQKNSGFGSWSLPRINGNHNTGIGAYGGYMTSTITGNGNTFIGPSTGVDLSTLEINNVMVIGNPSAISSTGGYRPVAQSNTVYIGSTKDILLTQSYTGSSKTVRFNSTGLIYGGNYSSGFGARNLVDKGYVTGTTYLTANNGITKSGGNFRLGGTLTGATTIKTGAFDYGLTIQGGNSSSPIGSGQTSLTVAYDDFQGFGILDMFGTDQATQGTRSSIRFNLLGHGDLTLGAEKAGQSFQLMFDPNLQTAIFSDQRTIKRGIQYGANYSTDFNSRSLVDAGFVTGTTYFTANNGLTKSGANVRLGGTLTGNTLVALANRSLTLSGTSGGLTLAQHSGGIYIQDKGQGGLYMDSGNATIVGSVIDLASWQGTGNATHRSKLRVDKTLIDLSSRGNIFLTALSQITLQNLSGGTLSMTASGNILTGGAGQGGWKYASNYSANYSARSIVDAGFVTGITSTLLTNSVNGINVTTSYSATTSSEFIGVSGTTALLVYLPVTPKPYQKITVKDIKGNALSANITINGAGKLIDGSSTAIVNTNYGCIQLIYNTVGWSVVGFA